jgi:hypothetical protein
MSDQLATYLHDHLAGARFAIELLERMRDSHSDRELRDFAAKMVAEIEEDRAILQGIADNVGDGTSAIKEATAWIAEKASRLKIRLGDGDDLATFEALEALSLGILGKLKLWQALSTISQHETRLQGIDLAQLAMRAQTQHDQIETHRRTAASRALR